MLRVELRQARAGMELAVPVIHPKSPDTMLLREGFVLDDRSINRLSQMGMREIWIRYPGLEFVSHHICPAIVRAGCKLTTAIGETFDDALIDANATLEYNAYRSAIADLMAHLVNHSSAGLFIVDMASSDIPLARSAGRGCYLSMLMGLKLETYLMLSRTRMGIGARDVSSLGMGALLRDVGMLQIAEADRWKLDASWDDENPEWREHVRIGYEMVRGQIEPSAAAAVLHHHQRFDGSGFPDRQEGSGKASHYAGEDIHIFARIIAAADLFDHMRYPHAPGPAEPEPAAVPVVRVLNRLLRGKEASGLDPIVVKALISVAPPFPPGSMVVLNNGLRCFVASWVPSDPCRPSVVPMDEKFLETGRYEAPTEVIDLREQTDLSIKEIDGQDISEDLFFPFHEGELDVYKAQRELITRPISSCSS